MWLFRAKHSLPIGHRSDTDCQFLSTPCIPRLFMARRKFQRPMRKVRGHETRSRSPLRRSGVSQTVRDDRLAAEAAPDSRFYDVDAQVQRFLTLIASGGTAAPSAAAPSATAAPPAPAATASAAGPGSTNVLPLGLKVVGFVVLGLVGGALTFNGLRTTNKGASAGATSATSATRPRESPVCVPMTDQPFPGSKTHGNEAEAAPQAGLPGQ
jgi:hypothetical protein